MHHELIDVMLWIVSIIVGGLFSIRIVVAIYLLKVTVKTAKPVAKVPGRASREESMEGWNSGVRVAPPHP